MRDNREFAEVTCPDCGATTEANLPRSARDVSVEPQEGAVDTTDMDRPRDVVTHCPDGHELTVVFDW
jgi:ribosomal protein S27E